MKAVIPEHECIPWPAELTEMVAAEVRARAAETERQIRQVLDAGQVPIHIVHAGIDGRDEVLSVEEAERRYGPLDPTVIESSTKIAEAWWEYADRVATGTPYGDTVDAEEFVRRYLQD